MSANGGAVVRCPVCESSVSWVPGEGPGRGCVLVPSLGPRGVVLVAKLAGFYACNRCEWAGLKGGERTE
jgi:hypothetical protein